MTIDDFLSLLDKVRKRGQKWQACCPAHEDRQPSLSVSQGDDGRILLKCFAGCTPHEIVDAMGLELKDLFPEKSAPLPPRPQQAAVSFKNGKLYPSAESAAKAAAGSIRPKNKRYDLVGSWSYEEAPGKEVGRVCRFESPAEGARSKQYRPVYRDNDGWRVGDPPGGFPLYRLPEMKASTGPVFVVEGEKASDALAEVGFTVTSSAHGARSANRADWSPLAGRTVYLLPDNDPPDSEGQSPGRKYTDTVANRLLQLEPPARPMLLELPGLPPKGDAVEFMQQLRREGKSDSEIRAAIEGLAKSAPAYPGVGPASGEDARDDLPRVFLPGGASNVRITDCARELGRLLAESGDLYVHAGRVVQVSTADDGIPQLKAVDKAALPALLERVADLHTTIKQGKDDIAEVRKNCSKQQAELIAECEEFWRPLPVTRLLTRCPVLTEWQGNWVMVAGYHRGTGIYASGREPEDVPIEEAVELLTELLEGFGFSTPADKSRALAALVIPALLHGDLLRGRAPILLLEADASQTGKGYFAKLVAAIYADKVRTVTQRAGGVGSLEESISTYLIEGADIICLDNMRGKLDSPALESALTEDYFLARAPYGKSVRLDIRRTTFMMTSNRAELTLDMANRCSPVRLLKQPEGHVFRQYPGGRDLLEHVRHHQRRYLGAVFTVVRTWLEANRPWSLKVKHDFRVWAGSLDWIVQNIFGAAALCEGVAEIKTRMTTPHFNWLRDVARAVVQARQLDVWLRTHELVSVLQATEIEIPGVAVGTDLDDETVAKKAWQGTGTRLSRCFRGEHVVHNDETDVIRVDDLVVERRSQYDLAQREQVRYYRFSVATTNRDAVAANSSGSSGHEATAQSGCTDEEVEDGYSTATPAVSRAAAEEKPAATAASTSGPFWGNGKNSAEEAYSTGKLEKFTEAVAAQRQSDAKVSVDDGPVEVHKDADSGETEWVF